MDSALKLHNKDLKWHIETIYEGLKPFACTLCDSRLVEKHKMQRHIETLVHEGNKRYL